MESSPSAQSFIVPFPDPWRLQLSSPHRNFSHTSPEFTVVTNSFSRTPRRSLRSSSHTISQFTSTHLAQAQPIRTQAIPFPTAIQVVSVSHPLPSIPSTANKTSQPSRRQSNPGAGQLRPRRVLSPKPRPRPSRLQTTSPVSTPPPPPPAPEKEPEQADTRMLPDHQPTRPLLTPPRPRNPPVPLTAQSAVASCCPWTARTARTTRTRLQAPGMMRARNTAQGGPRAFLPSYSPPPPSSAIQYNIGLFVSARPVVKQARSGSL